MRHEAERIFVRPLVETDVDENYLSWFRDTDVTAFLEARNLSREDVLRYIERGRQSGEYFMFAICDLSTGRHIGNLKLGPIDAKHRISDLVTVIGDKEFWGKGLATEAIRVGNQIAFEQYDIRKLTGGMYADNVGSLKCYTRAGWVEEARLVGQYILGGKVMDRIVVSCFNPKYFETRDGRVVAIEATGEPAQP